MKLFFSKTFIVYGIALFFVENWKKIIFDALPSKNQVSVSSVRMKSILKDYKILQERTHHEGTHSNFVAYTFKLYA